MPERLLVLVRHGQSTWNRENRFTGWTDVPLSPRGIAEAERAGEILRGEGIHFDVAFTSLLRRAIRTLWIMLEGLDQLWIPEHKHWRLNERHYGALQGLDKAQTAREYGEEQVRQWRRGWDVRPPAREGHPPEAGDPRYRGIDPGILRGESLKDTVARVVPYWESDIRPQLLAGRNVLVAAHGNSLRALIKFIQGIADDAIPDLEIPTGIPYVLRLDPGLEVIEAAFRGEPLPISTPTAYAGSDDRGAS